MKPVSKSGWKNPPRMSAALSLFLFACGAAPADTDSLGTVEEALVEPMPGITVDSPYDQLPLEISNANSGKCLNLPNGATAPETPVVQNTCQAKNSHTWFVAHVGNGVYQIRSAEVGQNLEIRYASADNGAIAQIYEVPRRNSQRFKIIKKDDELYEIRPIQSNRCLEVQNGSIAEGATVQQWDCHNNGDPNQLWRFRIRTNPFNLIAKSSTKCVTVAGASTSAGALLDQEGCTTAVHQRWQLSNPVVASGRKFWSIVSNQTGMCLDVAGGSQADGATIYPWPCTEGANQKWALEEQADGYVLLRNKNSNKCAGLAATGSADGIRIQQQTCNGNDPQRWFVAIYAERHVEVVQVANSDGSLRQTASDAQVQAHISRANALYSKYGIKLLFNPQEDRADLNSTTVRALGDDSFRGPCAGFLVNVDPGVCATRWANTWPNKIVVFLRNGGSGNSGSSPRSSYIAMHHMLGNEALLCGGVAGPDTALFAHEFGHYIGLAHSFTDEGSQANAAARAGNPDNFDGDAQEDTPPNPFWGGQECIAPTQKYGVVTLNGKSFVFLANNIMTYYNNVSRDMTPGQASLTRAERFVRRW